MNPFPPVSKSEWLAKVEADLKGASPDRLRSTAPDGLEIEPLYTAEDPHAQGAAGFPGVFPYVRGSAPVGGWLIRQEYDDPRPSVCKAQIELDLGRGVEAVWLRVGPRHGCRVLTTKELDDLLGSVDLTATSTYIEGGSDALAVAAGFLAVAASRGVSPEAAPGCRRTIPGPASLARSDRGASTLDRRLQRRVLEPDAVTAQLQLSLCEPVDDLGQQLVLALQYAGGQV